MSDVATVTPALADFVKSCIARGKRVFFTSRSHIIAFQRCPRYRWWSACYGGRGIVRKRLDVPLATGGFTHIGLAALLLGKSVDEAVGLALEGYAIEVQRRGLELEASEQQAAVAAEQIALTEALIRLAALRVIPELLTEYEIIDVERDEWFVLFEDEKTVIIVETRADAVLRERAVAHPFANQGNATITNDGARLLTENAVRLGDLYLLSWKTAAAWDARSARNAKTDMQGLSEAYPVELRLQEPVMGVKMVHLLKGRRQEDDWHPGTWQQRSPLIRAWLREGGPTPEWAWTYAWKDQNEVNDRGNPVSHKLGKGFRLVFIPDHMPVKEWIDMLNAVEVQWGAGDCLERQYISPMPEPRSAEQKRRWLRQVETQEIGVAQFVDELGAIASEESDMLDAYFPQYTHSCNYPKKCAYWDFCHGSETVEGEDATDPLSLFQIRTPHHPGEGIGVEE